MSYVDGLTGMAGSIAKAKELRDAIPSAVILHFQACVNTLVDYKVTVYRLLLFGLFRLLNCCGRLYQTVKTACYPPLPRL